MAMFIEPCPFCGNCKCFNDSLSVHYVICPGCGVMGPTGKDETDAILRWNERTKTQDTQCSFCNKPATWHLCSGHATEHDVNRE